MRQGRALDTCNYCEEEGEEGLYPSQRLVPELFISIEAT